VRVLEIFVRRANPTPLDGESCEAADTTNDIGISAARSIMQHAIGPRLKDWDTHRGVILIQVPSADWSQSVLGASRIAARQSR